MYGHKSMEFLTSCTARSFTQTDLPPNEPLILERQPPVFNTYCDPPECRFPLNGQLTLELSSRSTDPFISYPNDRDVSRVRIIER